MIADIAEKKIGTREWSDACCEEKNPLVSVLMLSYNHAKYIAQAIAGVIRQTTDFPIELLIGDDASTDNTLEIALDYQRVHSQTIRVFRRNVNIGFPENFRRLVISARGKYTAFCEGDDYWIDDKKLADQVSLMEKDESISLVHADFVIRNDFWGRKFILKPQGVLSGIPDKSVLRGDISESCFGGLSTHTSTILCRTRHLKDYIASKWIRYSGFAYDRAVVNYLGLFGDVAYIDRPVSAYRISTNSITRSGPKRDLLTALELRQFFDHFRSATGKYSKNGNEIYIRYTRDVIRNAFWCGDEEEYHKAYSELRSLVRYPVFSRLSMYQLTFHWTPSRILLIKTISMLLQLKGCAHKIAVLLGCRKRIRI